MKNQTGFSLLELSIAIGVMAIGMSGLCALLIHAVAGTALASQNATAAWLASGLAQQLALTPLSLQSFPDHANPTPECTSGAHCSPIEFTRFNLSRWQENVARTMPQGQGIVCQDGSPDDGMPGADGCDGSGHLVIKVFWRQPASKHVQWARHTQRLDS